MKASEILIRKIKHFEGLRLEAYQDVKGVWTIGFGHTNGVKSGDKITKKQATKLLEEDLAYFEKFVDNLHICDNQGKFDALTDFAFNCGIANLIDSTLLRYIKEN